MFLIGIRDVIIVKPNLKYVIFDMKHGNMRLFTLINQAIHSVGNKVTFN